jgi:diadenosine tetraphosphate (Ap4A) HIT family hydrolase
VAVNRNQHLLGKTMIVLVQFRFLMNQDAQVHLLVIPRYRSQRTWQGRIFDDPNWGSAAGQEQRRLPLDALAELAREISAELRSGRQAAASGYVRPDDDLA